MFCPKCGAQNPDGVPFCGSCGTPTGAQPQPAPQQPAAVGAAPFAAPGAASAPKGGLSKKAILIGLIAVAAVIVIAIIVGIVTCSGGGKAPNLNGLVGDKSEQVAGTLEKLSKGTDNGEAFFSANDDMRDLVKKASKAVGESDKKKLKDLKEDIKKQSPWAVALMDDKGKYLDLKDVKDNGDDPSCTSYATYRVLEKPKSEDIAKIVGEVCKYDKIIVGYDDSSEIYTGAARTNDEVIAITAREYEGVYVITAWCYRLDEISSSDSAEDAFDSLYEDYADKDLDDVYRK